MGKRQTSEKINEQARRRRARARAIRIQAKLEAGGCQICGYNKCDT